ncbi:hypothetical protein QTP86_001436 [Hemibagrus guttatus]|nr:hypothetical protein QTP86_001436 [Hemibagrus guttatus]
MKGRRSDNGSHCGSRQSQSFRNGFITFSRQIDQQVCDLKLKENVWPSVCDLKLKRTWVLQQDNDPKHTSKSTSEWLKNNKMKTLEWPSQSPDLNPIEMLWHDLKKVVHARKPSNVAELQQFCKDEWAKIPPQCCNRLIASYRNPTPAHWIQSLQLCSRPSHLTSYPSSPQSSMDP